MIKSYRPAGVGMVPALPGTYLLHAYFDGDAVDLVRANVLGWQISSGRSPTPLVLDPKAAELEPWVIGFADGRIECSDGRCWDSLEAWLADEKVDQLHGLARRKPAISAPTPPSEPCAATAQ